MPRKGLFPIFLSFFPPFFFSGYYQSPVLSFSLFSLFSFYLFIFVYKVTWYLDWMKNLTFNQCWQIVNLYCKVHYVTVVLSILQSSLMSLCLSVRLNRLGSTLQFLKLFLSLIFPMGKFDMIFKNDFFIGRGLPIISSDKVSRN